MKFGTLRPTARKVWVFLHVGFSVGWLGVSMTMLVLASVGARARDPALRHYAYEFMHVLDMAIVIPVALLTLITGLVVSLGTKWGLVRHWWVLAKLGIALAIPIYSIVQQRFWLEEAVRSSVGGHAAGLSRNDVVLWACAVIYTLLLWVATAVSTVKPWGRTRWAPAPPPRRAAAVR
ncbi:hypothetical protein NRB56_29430 [Nocardia sp. RB56]|uniref:DUF2269 domain-containing protein n=2 Tax=Nocardia aurantia TaxID=2585199 RepID=A0A7K0DNN9_9NOCA|nr:hypothetical protein [Nocardia aurantia]